jgi:Holliday junction resolvasome RuvABC endonuclease subunit
MVMIKRILGLDISLNSPGFAVVDVDTKTCECSVVRIGSTSTKKVSGRGEKLLTIYKQMKFLSEEFEFDSIVAEQGFFRFKPATQALYSAIGVVQMAFHKKEIIFYAPGRIKKLTTGNGLSSKSTVAECIISIFYDDPRLREFSNDDESDALAVVIAYVEDSEEFKNG